MHCIKVKCLHYLELIDELYNLRPLICETELLCPLWRHPSQSHICRRFAIACPQDFDWPSELSCALHVDANTSPAILTVPPSWKPVLHSETYQPRSKTASPSSRCDCLSLVDAGASSLSPHANACHNAADYLGYKCRTYSHIPVLKLVDEFVTKT